MIWKNEAIFTAYGRAGAKIERVSNLALNGKIYHANIVHTFRGLVFRQEIAFPTVQDCFDFCKCFGRVAFLEPGLPRGRLTHRYGSTLAAGFLDSQFSQQSSYTNLAPCCRDLCKCYGTLPRNVPVNSGAKP